MENLQVRITKLLMGVGVNPGILGYKYLRSGIEKVYTDDEIIQRMTKGLYPAIAEEHNTTPSRVERAIRHAIEQAFNCMRPSTVSEYFGYVVQYESGKVTNTAFIACLVEYLRMEDIKEGQE